MAGERVFQSLGAAAEKALSPSVQCLVRGMVRRAELEDRSLRAGVWRWNRPVR